MKRINNSHELSSIVQAYKKDGKKVGFAPTMGALHEGHFSLIKRSQLTTDISIASIFVNPTQFNQKEDLDKYPRTTEADCAALESIGCDYVYLPTVADIYPNGSDYKVNIDLAGLDRVMEGAKRPGHFEGVVQVVKRLLEIVQCDQLFMGQKDYQQFTIIRHMIRYFGMPVELIVCPTLREPDGLAMSSRNRRLDKDIREDANIINRVLIQAKKWLGEKPIDEITNTCVEYLSIPNFRPEYFEIVNGHTLRAISTIEDADEIVACTAVWAGDVRLIDNMILREN